MEIAQLYQLYLQHPSVQTDTRKLKKGDLFFALSGPNFNGNHFALQALEAGAAYAVVDELPTQKNDQLIVVDNVLLTLQALAKYHRQQFTIPFIAITGSNGKTTTKELVSTVLSKKMITYTTVGNLNNHIGIPLTILSVQSNAEIAVIEMGANHQKEIEGYCTYTLPTHGIITNCGKAHLEGFGGVEGVKKGKGELFDYLRIHQGTAFICNDLDYLVPMSKGIHEIFTYGTKTASIIGKVQISTPFITVQVNSQQESCDIETQLVGDYNLPNVLCAVAIGTYFNIPLSDIKAAIESYQPGNSRSQMLQKGTNHIVLDAYNANPTSMKAAIENFAKINAVSKVLLIGGMMELGADSLNEHKAIINLLQQYNFSNVVLVGGDFASIDHPFIFFKDAQQAKIWFESQNFTNTYFLVKGSRSMMMEKIVQ